MRLNCGELEKKYTHYHYTEPLEFKIPCIIISFSPLIIKYNRRYENKHFSKRNWNRLNDQWRHGTVLSSVIVNVLFDVTKRGIWLALDSLAKHCLCCTRTFIVNINDTSFLCALCKIMLLNKGRLLFWFLCHRERK